MKQILLILLCFFLFIGIAVCEIPATPTDLIEDDDYVIEEYDYFDDDDYGYINEHFIPTRIFIDYIDKPLNYGEKVTLVVILMDFFTTSKYTFNWEYSLDGIKWKEVEDEHEQTYSFILNEINCDYYWRVKLIIQEVSL